MALCHFLKCHFIIMSCVSKPLHGLRHIFCCHDQSPRVEQQHWSYDGIGSGDSLGSYEESHSILCALRHCTPSLYSYNYKYMYTMHPSANIPVCVIVSFRVYDRYSWGYCRRACFWLGMIWSQGFKQFSVVIKIVTKHSFVETWFSLWSTMICATFLR
jgi:hypothetical protein